MNINVDYLSLFGCLGPQIGGVGRRQECQEKRQSDVLLLHLEEALLLQQLSLQLQI